MKTNQKYFFKPIKNEFKNETPLAPPLTPWWGLRICAML